MISGRQGFESLIVDYGGVLTTSLQEALLQFALDAGIDLQDFVRVALGAYSGSDDSLVHEFETGRVPQDEFEVEMAARLTAVAPAPVDPEGLVARMFAGVTLDEEMLGLVEDVRAMGLRTGLLSNSWGLGFYPRERLAQLFDTIVISGEVGLRKPDPAIFELACRRLEVEPSACVFVDDHPGHLEAAAGLGMTTVLHRSASETRAAVDRLLGGGASNEASA